MSPHEDMQCSVSHAELTHVSRIIHKGPCLVTGFVVSGHGAAGTADIYDGESDAGEHKCRIKVISNTSFPWPIVHPVDFDKGIYIKVTEETTYVTVCYIPESWKHFA